MKSLFRIYKVTVWKQNTRAHACRRSPRGDTVRHEPGSRQRPGSFPGELRNHFFLCSHLVRPPPPHGERARGWSRPGLTPRKNNHERRFRQRYQRRHRRWHLRIRHPEMDRGEWGQAHGSLTGTSTTIGPGLIAFTGTFSFSGGTGRFRDATAEANFVGGAQFTDPDDPSQGGTGFVSFSGTLSRRN